MACPFGAIELLPLYDNTKPVKQASVNETKVAAYKCDRCYRRDEPACVSVCPHEALRKAVIATEVQDKKLKAALTLASLEQHS